MTDFTLFVCVCVYIYIYYYVGSYFDYLWTDLCNDKRPVPLYEIFESDFEILLVFPFILYIGQVF
jgi:hypothetical protein